MDLISPIFLFLFLPVFILIFSLFRGRLKLFIGMAGSIVFYAWGGTPHSYLLIGLVVFTYLHARLIDRWRGETISSVVFRAGILIPVALLLFFKLRTGTAYPFGLSYITFQIISYFVDVQKTSENCEKDFFKFSFYLLLFPKIPVGPIVPYRQIKDQLNDLKPEPQDMADGLRRFLLGFAKKALIADTLGAVVTPVFHLQSPVIIPGFAWLVIVSYSLQLYYDFSGYTDMAIGVGRMMGVRFSENFDAPYLSKSIGEFWRRWHISLSTWFREIVFYPLERRRFHWCGQQINIMVVFMLTGLWHGATRNFLLWGAWHGAAIVFEFTPVGRKLRNLWTPLQHLYALTVILIGWVIFRSPTPDFAFDFLRRLAGDMSGVQTLPFDLTSPLPFIEPTFIIALALGVGMCLPLADWFRRYLSVFNAEKYPVLQLVYDAGLLLIFLDALASAASASYLPGIYGTF